MRDLQSLSAEWIRAKREESDAAARRRAIEDAMLSLIGIPETLDGTENAEAPGGYRIKVVGRINRKVDGDKLQELAAEAGLSDHLARLFRWKPEINARAWEAADESITRPLAGAITAKPGRPSFAITTEE
jgi:hypothetical protein